MCHKLSPPRRVDRFAWNCGGIYNSTRAIAWGNFPLPVGTSEPEIWLFWKLEVGTGNWKYSRWKENKILYQNYYSTFLIFWPGEASESSKDFSFPCMSVTHKMNANLPISIRSTSSDACSFIFLSHLDILSKLFGFVMSYTSRIPLAPLDLNFRLEIKF